MADIFDDALPMPLGDPFEALHFSPEEAVSLLTDVGQTVADCAQVVADFETTLSEDIAACLASCNGDTGLCHACILGDIAEYVNRSGLIATGCGQKVIDQVNEDMGTLWQAAANLGIPPPGQEQLLSALSGTTVISDGGDVITPPVPPPVVIPPPPVVTGPGGLGVDPVTGEACIPHDWTATTVNNWAVLVFGAFPGAELRRMPTQDTPGIWWDGQGERTIPKVCTVAGPGTVFPPPETLPGGGGGGTIITVPVPPVTPPSGTIVTVPTPPAGSSQSTTVNCPPPQITVNVPPCPTLPGQTPAAPPTTYPPTKTCPNCLVCYGDGSTAVIPSDDPRLLNLPIGAVILGCSANSADLLALAAKCGVVAVIPPTQPPPAQNYPPTPQVNLGNLCSPNTIHFTAEYLGENASALGAGADLASGTIGAVAGRLISGAVGKLFGIDDSTFLTFVTNVTGSILGAASGDLVKELVEPVISGSFCKSDTFFNASVRAAISKAFGGWFGAVPEQTVRSLDYVLNWYCPNIIPSAGEVDSLFQRGYIDDKAWLGGVTFNGECPEWHRQLVELKTTRIGVQDAYRLWQLGQLDEGQFLESWKRLGIDTEKEAERFKQSVIQYPGMADLVRMMVRDVGDPSVVELLGLDAEFDEKWADSSDSPLKTWGKAQGVEDSVARAFWRAHWQAPSPQQIYTWLWRLRPDDRDPNDPFKDLVVTEDDAKRLLQIADYVPGLVGNYIAASYRPITRVDIRRLYRVGVIEGEDGIRRAYRDLGYNAPNAEKLAKFTVLTEQQAKAKLEGNLTVNEVLGQYKNGLLTRQEALALLLQAGMTDDQANVSLSANDVRRQSDSRKRIVSALRSRYFKGEFSDNQAAQELVNAYMGVDQATDLVSLWSAELKAKEKQPTVAMLCKWYGQGMITIDEYMRRVENLNYSQVNALHIVDACNNDLLAKRQREIAAAQQKALKEQQASNRLAAQQLRQAKADARALKLLHKREHKVVTKDDKGRFTTTITETFTDKPDDNITEITQQISVNGDGK